MSHIIPTEDLLNQENRKKAYEVVRTHPGMHLREVARHSELPLGTAMYHLGYLERSELITSSHEGRYKRYFTTTNGLKSDEKKMVTSLRHEKALMIVKALASNSDLTQLELCALVRVSRSTMSSHLARLVEEKIVKRDAKPGQREVRFSLIDPRLAKLTIDNIETETHPEAATG